MADLTHTSQGRLEAQISLPYPQSVLPLRTSKPLHRWVSLPHPQVSQLRSPLLSPEAIHDCPPSHLVEAFGSLPWLPYPGSVTSACVSPITTATIPVSASLSPHRAVCHYYGPTSPSLGIGTENINEMSK